MRKFKTQVLLDHPDGSLRPVEADLCISALGERALLRAFLASDPALGGVNVQQLANRLYARGLRAPVKP